MDESPEDRFRYFHLRAVSFQYPASSLNALLRFRLEVGASDESISILSGWDTSSEGSRRLCGPGFWGLIFASQDVGIGPEVPISKSSQSSRANWCGGAEKQRFAIPRQVRGVSVDARGASFTRLLACCCCCCSSSSSSRTLASLRRLLRRWFRVRFGAMSSAWNFCAVFGVFGLAASCT
jgi:hypothetical protein